MLNARRALFKFRLPKLSFQVTVAVARQPQRPPPPSHGPGRLAGLGRGAGPGHGPRRVDARCCSTVAVLQYCCSMMLQLQYCCSMLLQCCCSAVAVRRNTGWTPERLLLQCCCSAAGPGPGDSVALPRVPLPRPPSPSALPPAPARAPSHRSRPATRVSTRWGSESVRRYCCSAVAVLLQHCCSTVAALLQCCCSTATRVRLDSEGIRVSSGQVSRGGAILMGKSLSLSLWFRLCDAGATGPGA